MTNADLTDLPSGWSITPLADLVDILDSKRVPVNREERAKRSGVVPYYGATGQVGWIDEPLFDEELMLLGEDGVQFLDATKPKAYMISGPSWVNNHAHVLRAVAGKTTNRFLLHYLNSFDFHGFVTGTTRLKLNQGSMKTIPVVVPPIDEQRHIVEAIETHLSHLDAGVESLQRAKRNVERMRASALHSLFDGIDGHVLALGDLAEVVGGVTKDKKSEQDPMTVEVSYLRVANVQRGYLDLSEVKTIRVRPEKVERLLLEEGDILFTEGGDRDKLGRGWVWEEQIDRCIHQNHIFRARPNDGGVLPKFVSTYANVFGREWFEGMGKQTTNLASISLTNLRKFPVPVPSIEIQRQIMGQVDLYNSILGAVTDAVATATTRGERLRAAVLSSAFNGQLNHMGRGRVHS